MTFTKITNLVKNIFYNFSNNIHTVLRNGDNVSDHIRLNSSKYTTKFLFDSFNIHHIEFMERLYNNDFVMEACYGGGLEGQQFNEYIFVKCKK